MKSSKVRVSKFRSRSRMSLSLPLLLPFKITSSKQSFWTSPSCVVTDLETIIPWMVLVSKVSNQRGSIDGQHLWPIHLKWTTGKRKEACKQHLVCLINKRPLIINCKDIVINLISSLRHFSYVYFYNLDLLCIKESLIYDLRLLIEIQYLSNSFMVSTTVGPPERGLHSWGENELMKIFLLREGDE